MMACDVSPVAMFFVDVNQNGLYVQGGGGRPPGHSHDRQGQATGHCSAWGHHWAAQ